MRRVVLATVVISALFAAGAVAALATAATSGGQSGAVQVSGVQKGNMGVQLRVSRFVKSGHRLIARGKAVARYTSANGKPTVASQPFSAHATVVRRTATTAAGTTTTCPVLTLELDQVSLDLLGLHVDLSKVILTVTANPNGGTLGKLFCQLATGKTALASAPTAHSLTSAARRSGLSTHGVAVGTTLTQMATLGPGPCSVVDLLLGPLHLDVLGLIVDLNQVHLQITADPTEAPLGSLLCSLTNPPTTT